MSPSVRDHLRGLIREEGSRTSWVLVRARVALTVPYLVATVVLGYAFDLADWRGSIPLTIAYASGAAALLGVTWVRRSALRFAGFAVGLFDMPMFTLISLDGVALLDNPIYLLSSLPPLLLASIGFAALSLNQGAIGLACASAVVCSVLAASRVGAPVTELIPVFLALAVLGVGSSVLVSRLKALVAESRRKDFAGKYVLGERIGAGGMAEVFAATYSPEGGFERRVAVKRVLPAHADNADFIALFRREAELGAMLQHPNLVQVLDFARHLDSWFLAMEYIDGVSLGSLLRALRSRQERLPLPACLYVLSELAEALAYLHERPSPDGTLVGLVHRDVNPPNVLLSRDGAVKLSDFGVARWQSTDSGLTQVGETRGKLAYMPPDQLTGGAPVPAWDLFALGATAYEMLTGVRLFEGNNEGAVMQAVVHQPIFAPSTFRPEVPPEVDAIVLALLERDASKRLPQARMVSTRLRAMEGPLAPYPRGQRALVDVIASVDVTTPAQAPSSSTPYTLDHEGKTATVMPAPAGHVPPAS